MTFQLEKGRQPQTNTFWVLGAIALEPQADHADEDDHNHNQDDYEADDTCGWMKKPSAIDLITLLSLSSGAVQGLDSHRDLCRISVFSLKQAWDVIGRKVNSYWSEWPNLVL